MKTYSTYQEAKISEPECKIYTNGKSFGTDDVFDTRHKDVAKCNPADYCMTVEEFLSDGNEFVEGDIVITMAVCVHEIDDCELWNKKSESDSERFILRAAALEHKKTRTCIEYVRVNDSVFDLRRFSELPLYISGDGENYYGFKGDERTLMRCILDGFLYRKVETEIDERQEFVDAACEISEKTSGKRRKDFVEDLFDSGLFKYIGGDDADK